MRISRRIYKRGRLTGAVLAMSMALVSFTGCGGSSTDNNGDNSSTAAVKSYKNETIELIEGNNENTSLMSVKYFDGDVYYQRYDYPEYPQEFYDEMNKLDEAMGANTSDDSSASDDASSATDIEGKGTDSESDAGNSDADKNSVDSKADNKTSDDDLLGDVDDLFGDGKKDDGKKDDDKKDDSKKDDSGEITTYEELYAKYADYKTTCGMYKYNIDTKETTKLFEFNEEEGGSISDFYPDKDGNLIVINEKYNYDEKTGDSNAEYMLKKYGADGSELNSIKLNDKLNLEKGTEDMGTSLESIRIIDADRILAKNNNNIILFDSEGNEKAREKADNFYGNFILDSEGNLIAECMENDKMSYVKYDAGTLKKGDKIEGILDDKAEYSPYVLMDGNESHSLYMKDSTALYSFDYSDGSKNTLLKFMDVGLIGDCTDSVVFLDDGRIFYNYHNPDDGRICVGILSESDEAVDNSREVINIMMMYSDSDIQKKIIEYNKADNKYKIELTSFDNDPDPLTSMNNQLTAGNIPDILEVSNVDIRSYIAKNLLEDMTPYISKDDRINEDYFVDGYLNAISFDGKQYCLSKSFSIYTIAGKASELKQYKDGWTANDIIEYYKSKPEGTQLFLGDSKLTAFYNLLQSDIDSYVDWNTGEVNIDSEDFRNVLEFCNTFPDEEGTAYDIKKNDYKDDKILLRNESVYNSETIQIDKKLFGEDCVYVGFPSKSGKGTYLNSSMAFGICSSSDKKEAAWEIIKELLYGENESSNSYEFGGDLPASKEKFEAMVKRDTTTKKYKDEQGNEVEPRNSTYGYEDFEIKLTPATDDEIETLRELIKSSKGIGRSMDSVSDMIYEDVSKYFDGSKTLDEVVKILQDKMSKYINENK